MTIFHRPEHGGYNDDDAPPPPPSWLGQGAAPQPPAGGEDPYGQQQYADPNAYAPQDPNQQGYGYEQQGYDPQAYAQYQDYPQQEGGDQYAPPHYSGQGTSKVFSMPRVDGGQGGDVQYQDPGYDQQGYAGQGAYDVPGGYDPYAQQQGAQNYHNMYQQPADWEAPQEQHAPIHDAPMPIPASPPQLKIGAGVDEPVGPAKGLSIKDLKRDPGTGEQDAAPVAKAPAKPESSAGGPKAPPSVKDLANREKEAPPPQSFGSLENIYVKSDRVGAAHAPHAAEPDAPPPGTEDRRALDRDGIPRYVPPMPENLEEMAGAGGRRATAFGWIITAAVVGFFFFSAGKATFGGFFITPIALLGAIMMSGAKWTGTFGMALSIVYALLFGGMGGLILSGAEGPMPSVIPMNELPVPMAYGMMVLAAAFPLGSIIGLAGAPGAGRGVVAAILLLLANAGGVVLGGVIEVRPTYNVAETAWESEGMGDRARGFYFEKPAGWAAVEWAELSEKNPLAKALAEAPLPEMCFVNKDQNVIALVVHDTSPRKGIASSLLGGDVRTDGEKLLTLDLPQIGDAKKFAVPGSEREGETFLFEGTPSKHKIDISIVLDRIVTRERNLVLMFLRDRKSKATIDQVLEARGEFYAGMEVK